MKRAAIQRKTPMRSRSRTKSTPARQSACGQSCTLQLPGCRNDAETVVLCHLRQFGGGGIALKPSDLEAVYGCAHCHDRIDGRARSTADRDSAAIWETIARALVHTHRQMRAAGILILKGETA